MPHIATRSITAALLLTLSITALALPSPQSHSNQTQTAQSSTQLNAIDAAVEATKTDPTAVVFIITLPDDYQQSRQIRDQWLKAKTSLNNHPVFFVTGQTASSILDAAYLTTNNNDNNQATIAYRNGRPHHSRTGTLSTETLNNFIALSLNSASPLTNAPSQTKHLYDELNQLTLAGQQATAAKAACQLMLNLHALINGPYASTYSDSDLTDMAALYNQSQLTLSSLDLSDQTVLDEINSARATAIKTWNKRTTSTFGFGIWSDLAMITGDTDSILTWIDQGLDHPFNAKRVAKTLADYGQPLAQLLIDTHRYEALAMTITSPTQIADQLAASKNLADQIAQLQGQSSPAHQNLINQATTQAATYHAALLLAGRDTEAWQVAKLTKDFTTPQHASEALAIAAINTGTLQDRHAFLIRDLDQTKHASIINAMTTTFAVVPTDN